jgi:hypothetical protein
VQLLDVCLVEIELGYGAGDLGVGQDAELLAAVHETLDLFEFLKFRYRHFIPFQVWLLPWMGARI